MQNFTTFFSCLLLAALVASCSGEAQTPSDKTKDEILAAFPQLEAKPLPADSVELRSRPNQFLYRAYHLRDSTRLFSGTLTNDGWNDSLRAEGTFKDGKLQKFVSRFPDGTKNSEMTVTPGDNETTYVTRTWYPSGELKSKYNDRTGERYYRNGSIKADWNERSATNYWKNGNRQYYRPLKDSSRSSVLDGRFKAWHPNGVLATEGRFDDGRKDGRWMYHDSTGELEKTMFFDKGKKDSTIHHSQ